MLDGLEPDMTDADDGQGLLTSGRRSVDFGVLNKACPSVSWLASLLLRTRGELQGTIDMPLMSLNGQRLKGFDSTPLLTQACN